MLNNGGCLIWHKVPGDLALELQRIGCKEKAQKTMLVDPMTQHRLISKTMADLIKMLG